MLQEYERSASLAKTISKAYTKTKVDPQWVGENGCFCYLREVEDGKHSFIYVDPSKEIRRPAFDHELLAGKLGSSAGIEAKADALPFKTIYIDVEKEVVRFRAEGKKWQFESTGSVTEYDGELSAGRLQPLQEEVISSGSTQTSAIRFRNEKKVSISIYWIDGTGLATLYSKIKPGTEDERQTYEGHVWRVTYTDSDKHIASYEAGTSWQWAVIEESLDSATKKISDSISQAGERTHSKYCRSEWPSKAFLYDNNVWLYANGPENIKITESGTKEHPFDEGVCQSSDDRFVVIWQYTPAHGTSVYRLESSPEDRIQPHLKKKQFLKAGGKERIDRPRMFDLVERKEVPTEDSLFQNPYRIKDLGWSKDGKEYRFLYVQRGFQLMRIIGMNTLGHVRTIIEESSSTFVDYYQKYFYQEIRSTGEIVWASERDGWNHLYLYDAETGHVKNQITKGDWLVKAIDNFDKDKRQVWVEVLGAVEGQDPYYSQLARVNLDGSDFKILTEGDGTHTWAWCPDQKYLIDTWSTTEVPPKTVVREAATGKEIMMLEENNTAKLSELGLAKAERFSAPGRDGKTMIYGVIIRPTNLENGKKYPVIDQIYAGPYDNEVPAHFTTFPDARAFAELGFVIVQIDGMGTNWRSKSFHNHCWKNLKDAGLLDHKTWLKAASESRPWMDLDRVGITGGSAGGQNAMAALLWHGDFFKAAVAKCGCHDNRMDKLWWNELWMGWPVDQSYEDSSNVVHAGKLKGALMLMVDEMDDNVDPSSTMQVVSALIKAEKDFELVVFPGKGHCEGEGTDYGLRRERDFFVRQLTDKKPPKWNEIEQKTGEAEKKE